MPPIAAHPQDPLPRMQLQYVFIDALIAIAIGLFDWWLIAGIYREWGIGGLVAGAGLIASGMVLIIWLDARRDRSALLPKPTSTRPTSSLRPVVTVVRGPGALRVPSVAGGRQLSSVGGGRPDPTRRLS